LFDHSAGDAFGVSSLMTTPAKTSKGGGCYSPFMYPTPQANKSDTPGMGSNWGSDETTLLRDTFSKNAFGGSNPPVTPGFMGTSSGSLPEAPPSTTTKFINSNVNTPRVFFKDDLTETYDFRNSTKAATPFTSSLVLTPARSKAVTGSGPDRIRVNALDEERDNLLSTAFLDTPKSPKIGNIQDMDQSLHHIDACIKSPLNFGSPNIKGSPMRHL
jgi:hypothetical protein